MRSRGFTITELMVAIAMLLILSGVVGGIVMTMRARDESTAAYAQDLSGLRRAARALETDLRAAPSLSAVDYELKDGTLLRWGKPLLTRVASFDLKAHGALARVQLTLAARARTSTRLARIAFDVRMRGVAGSEK